MSDEELEAFGLSRRDFFKKMIALGFAVPVVSSFALDGVASADEGWTSRANSSYHYDRGNSNDYDRDHDSDKHHHHHHHYRPNSTSWYRPNTTTLG